MGISETDTKPYRDKDVLESLYIEDGLSTREIADKLGCGRRTVTNWLYRLDIKTPSGNKPYHDENQLFELYIEQGKSAEEIAKKWDCSDLTIQRWLTRHGISRNGTPQNELWRDKELLRRLYCGLGLTNREIGEILGCSGNCVNEWLQKFEIERKLPKFREWGEIKRLRNEDGCTAETLSQELDINVEIVEGQHARYQDEVVENLPAPQNSVPGSQKPWHDREKLDRLYNTEDLEPEEIAEKWGCKVTTIDHWLRTFALQNDANRPWTDKDLLETLYVEEELTTVEIAERLGCVHTTVQDWINRHDITRDDKEPLWQIEGVLRTLYMEEGWSATEISEELGCSSSTVSEWLNRHNIADDGDQEPAYQDEDILYRMYKKEKKSVTEIADELGCSHGAICYWLARHGIETRTRDEIKHRLFDAEMGEKEPFKNENLLKKLYLSENLSIAEIAAELGCSRGAVRVYIDKFGIEKSEDDIEITLDMIDSEVPEKTPWRDEKLMREMYLERQLTTTEISDLLGCAASTVSNWLDNHSIDTRGTYDRPSRYELKRLYVDKRQSAEKIANRLDVSTGTILRWLRDNDIEIRSPSDYKHPALDDPSEMRRMYVEEGMTMSAIASELGASSNTVRAALDRHEIDVRPQGVEISGEKNPFWKGGQKPYGKGWTDKKRQEVLEDCDHICQSCGLTNEEHLEEYGQSLHIHHVLAASEFDNPEERNAISNLVAMCSSCHKRWEGIPLKPSFRIE